MPSSRKTILSHVMSDLCSKINRTKQLPNDVMETPLNRCLNTFDITLLGGYVYIKQVIDVVKSIFIAGVKSKLHECMSNSMCVIKIKQDFLQTR